MKLDAGLGAEGGYLHNAGETARAAESLGFAGLWTSETKHDAFLPLAIAANETERIELGTSVAIAFSRSPMEMAQTAWDLQDLSGGRFILGLGTQVKAHVRRRFSMPWDRPGAAARVHRRAARHLELFPDRRAAELRGRVLPAHAHNTVLQPRPDRAAGDPDLHSRRQHGPGNPRRRVLRRLPRTPLPQPGVRSQNRKASYCRGSAQSGSRARGSRARHERLRRDRRER